VRADFSEIASVLGWCELFCEARLLGNGLGSPIGFARQFLDDPAEFFSQLWLENLLDEFSFC
jgi:hypothetical protein